MTDKISSEDFIKAFGEGVSIKRVNVIPEPQQNNLLDKVKAIIDEYYLNVADKNSTDIKAYFFDKILDVFANEDGG
jgi:hypothetical protein